MRLGRQKSFCSTAMGVPHADDRLFPHTSGLRNPAGGWPAITAMTISADATARLRAASIVFPAVWGDRTTFGARRIGLSGEGGSASKTSSPAPPMRPACRASASALSSTSAPRAALIRIAVGFIACNSAAPMR